MGKFYRYRTKDGQDVRLEATSYRTRNPRTLHPNGWISQSHLWEDKGDTTLVLGFWPIGSRRFASKAEADRVALAGLARWLDAGRPKLRVLVSWHQTP